MTKKQLREERVYRILQLPGHIQITEGSRARNLRQKLKQEPQKDAAHCLAPRGFLSLYSFTAQDHLPRDGTTYNVLHPHTSITDLKNARQAGRRGAHL